MPRTAHKRIAAAALALSGLGIGPLLGAPKMLDCVLTDIETKGPGAKFDSQVGAEKRALTVAFDDGAKTLAVQQDNVMTPLDDVSISQTSMTGTAGNISVGVDRSSWHIVFQTYGEGSTHSEFGQCNFRL